MTKSTSKILNEDCFDTMASFSKGAVDVVLTSPPYNTSRDKGHKTLADNKSGYPTHRYDSFSDGMTDEEYEEWTVRLFNEFDRILTKGGCVLYNLSYGRNGASPMLNVMSRVCRDTAWQCFDIIYWHKKCAMPDNQSKNKLTRIVEPVYIFVRKGEEKDFETNKEVVSVRKTGQKMYKPIYNIFNAANNDKSNNLNKATFSTEFVNTLLEAYVPKGKKVYDPFMGTGTTGVSCALYGCDFIGSEISEKQCEFARAWIEKVSSSR